MLRIKTGKNRTFEIGLSKRIHLKGLGHISKEGVAVSMLLSLRVLQMKFKKI